MLTAQMVRDILALEDKGLEFDKLVEKIQSRLKEVTRNEVMGLVLELNTKGLVKYDLDVGTWQATVKLV